MKVDRYCPRCHDHLYHWVHAPKTGDETLDGMDMCRWPSDKIPYRAEICCAHCAHTWWGKLSRLERGCEDG